MDSFSYSAITTSRKCNKLFQHVYVDKLHPDTQPSGDMSFGTGVHLGVETTLEGDDGVKAFETYWDIEKTRDNKYGRFGWQDLKTQGIILLEKFEKYYLNKFEVYQMEQRLFGEYEGIKLEGTPDVVGKFEGIESVLDFKTAGYRYDKEKIRIAEQLYLYSYLAQTKLNYPVKQIVYLVFVKGTTPSIQKALIHPFKQEECNKVLRDLKEECKQLLWKQQNRVFTRNLGNCIMGINRCDFWEKCHGKTE